MEGSVINTALLQIGEVAKRAGVSIRTVRYYEETGLLAPSSVTSGGIRLYGQREVTRLRFIRRFKTLGLSIDEIKMSLGVAQSNSHRQNAPHTIELLELQKNQMEEKMEEFSQLCHEVDEALTHVTKCLSCSVAECPESCPNLSYVI